MPAPKHNVTAVEALRRARTLWPDITLSCDFEAETLPLLFAADDDCVAYFDALEALHHRKARLIHHVRLHTFEARKRRATGDWPGCIEALQEGCVEREAVFAFDDYQCVAARLHLAWTAVHAATIVAVGAETPEDSAAAHSMFGVARAVVGRVFGSATIQRESDLSPQHVAAAGPCRRWLHRRVNIVLHNNWANHWATRKRWAAAMQHATIAAKLANALLPHVPCSVTEAAKVRVRQDPAAPCGVDGDGAAVGTTTEVEIPPPPPELFDDERSTAFENPTPMVMIAETRRLICEAIGRSTGTAALSGREGHDMLAKLRCIRKNTAAVTAPPAPEPPATLLPPATAAEAAAAPQPSAWALLASEPTLLSWTMSSSNAANATPLPSILATADVAAMMAAAFVQLHLRATGKARESVDHCIRALEAAAASPAQPSDWPAAVQRMSRCVAIASDVSLVEARSMPRSATRQAEGLAMASLVRGELGAEKAGHRRQQRERAWLDWAVLNDETGALEEDSGLDPAELRAAFRLPSTIAETNTIAARTSSTLSHAESSSLKPARRAATPSGTGGGGGDASASLSVPPPFARATTPFGACRSRKTLAPACDLRSAATTATTISAAARRRERHLQQTTDDHSTTSAAASPSTPDEPHPEPAAGDLAESIAVAKKHAGSKAAHLRRKQLRSLLPRLDIHSKAYREIVRELAALEAAEREAREAAARDTLLAKAAHVAERACIGSTWKKTKAAKRLAEATSSTSAQQEN